MAAFPPSVLEYWDRAFAAEHAVRYGTLTFAQSASLDPKRPAMLLLATDGTARAVVTPELARRTRIAGAPPLTIENLTERLAHAGIRLHDPDYLFYLQPGAVGARDLVATPCRLSEEDRAAFDLFYHAASEQDRDDAWVELDHAAVFGGFDGDRLVCAASMTLWADGRLADLGVLTLPDARGRGYARAVVTAISQDARRQGYEPQYRCQIDNHASVALARSCGLRLFGQWIVAADLPDRAIEKTP